MRTVKITKEEDKAIASLEKIAKKWPESLMLFSWSGSLQVTKESSDGMNCVVTGIPGIPNDGGDPNQDEEIDQLANIEYE